MLGDPSCNIGVASPSFVLSLWPTSETDDCRSLTSFLNSWRNSIATASPVPPLPDRAVGPVEEKTVASIILNMSVNTARSGNRQIRRGEADLVVHHDMHGNAGTVAARLEKLSIS